jgi:outer membrane protein OmpA-like peptidoglycan-associated protein
MKTKTTSILGSALVLGLTAAACAPSMPPRELVDARTQYTMSAKGPAASETPAALHNAQMALERAERDFQDQGDKPTVRDEAYIALRKAQLADAQAQVQLALKAKATADADAKRYETQALAATQSALQATQSALGKSEVARQDAEKRAKMAMADLQKIASVKQEPRGMVITLSGSVLFASNESTLLPSAVLKLNDVADALTKNNPDSNITIEGHTDSQGSHDYNMQLSQKRADAVKAQLVARGVAADRIKTVGVGPDRPIANNKTAEGRANNRRVEIIVEPASGSGGPSGSATPRGSTPQP